MAKNPTPPGANNDNLLNALESIKGLLEQSESKLSAARQSIKKATPDIDMLFTDPAEEEVPVLNDIVIPPQIHKPGEQGIDPLVLNAFIDEMQIKLEKRVRETLMQSIVRAESDIKKQLSAYLNQLRKLINDEK
ncbi:MAG: hypothetical protein HY080_12510 [Gammaproteobacteria bacterium]|nr:hypothetical protein [Gammaproteobacteria bacterium]